MSCAARAIPAQWIPAASLLAIVGVQLAVLAILIGEIRSVRSDLGSQISNSDAQRQADTRAINAREDGAYRGP